MKYLLRSCFKNSPKNATIAHWEVLRAWVVLAVCQSDWTAVSNEPIHTDFHFKWISATHQFVWSPFDFIQNIHFLLKYDKMLHSLPSCTVRQHFNRNSVCDWLKPLFMIVSKKLWFWHLLFIYLFLLWHLLESWIAAGLKENMRLASRTPCQLDLPLAKESLYLVPDSIKEWTAIQE